MWKMTVPPSMGSTKNVSATEHGNVIFNVSHTSNEISARIGARNGSSRRRGVVNVGNGSATEHGEHKKDGRHGAQEGVFLD